MPQKSNQSKRVALSGDGFQSASHGPYPRFSLKQFLAGDSILGIEA
jgi:hypothetical protein